VLVGDRSSDPDNKVQAACEKSIEDLIAKKSEKEKELMRKKKIEFVNHLQEDISMLDEETFNNSVRGADIVLVLFDLS